MARRGNGRRGRTRGRKKRGHLSSQLTFPYKRRDGHRCGAKKKKGARVSHLTREELSPRHPVHVVLKLQMDLPSLRSKKPYKVLRRVFAAACDRFGFRLNHYSVLGDHLHLIVEAEDRKALSRGLNGLTVRIARNLNKLSERRGKVFADRYYAHILKTPQEVKNALAYVLNNARRHGLYHEQRPDIFSSGMWFDGWRDYRLSDFDVSEPPPLALARTWLQREGWRRHGLISVTGTGRAAA